MASFYWAERLGLNVIKGEKHDTETLITSDKSKVQESTHAPWAILLFIYNVDRIFVNCSTSEQIAFSILILIFQCWVTPRISRSLFIGERITHPRELKTFHILFTTVPCMQKHLK
jgi:hypothetical protein